MYTSVSVAQSIDEQIEDAGHQVGRSRTLPHSHLRTLHQASDDESTDPLTTETTGQALLVIQNGSTGTVLLEDLPDYIEKVHKQINGWEPHPYPASLRMPGEDGQDPLACPSFLRTTFVLFGVGALLPWSAFLSTRDFYVSAFVGVPFDLLLTVFHMVSMCFTSVYLTLFPRSQSQYATDIIVGFAFLTVVTLGVPMLVPPEPGGGWGNIHLWTIMIALTVLGIAGAVMETSMFGVAALFPHSTCTKGINAGAALSGVLFAFLRVGTLLLNARFKKATTGNAAEDAASLFVENRTSTYLFFYSCSLFSFFCVMRAMWVSNTREWKKTMRNAAVESRGDQNQPTLRHQLKEVKSLLAHIWQPFVALWVTTTITLGLYPAAFFIMRKATAGELSGRLSPAWFSVLAFGLFSFGDWRGREAPFEALRLNSRMSVLFAAFLHFSFCPLVILSARGVWFMADWSILILGVLLGGSNGLVSGASFVLGPTLVDSTDKDKAGKILFLGLMLGIATGALLGPVLLLLVRQSTVSVV